MKYIDISYHDTWKTRAIKLAGLSYEEYLRSDEWKAIKLKAKLKPNLQKCYICGSKDRLELHHRSYKHLGTTNLRNISAVCRDHHDQIHRYAKSYRISVRLATKKVRKCYINTHP